MSRVIEWTCQKSYGSDTRIRKPEFTRLLNLLHKLKIIKLESLLDGSLSIIQT